MGQKVGAGIACKSETVGNRPGLKAEAVSFEALIAKLSPTLKRITCKLNGHFTFMDDQDLLQEALIHLWCDFQMGKLDDKTDSYILQGCYFHLKNYIRKTQDSAIMLSLNSIMEEDGPHLEELLIADDLASYDRVEALLQIEAMGSGVSQRERDVLFFCLEGMTTREIGKKMGISHVSVVKIRNKIRERYQKLNGIAAGNGKTGKSLAA
jgi:RNA polymerase sigma factor (sigma-70 family)